VDDRQQPPQRTSRSSGFGGAAVAGSQLVLTRLYRMFTSRGWGFQRLAETHAGSVGGDTLVAVALAGTLFFSVPSTEARENVALYLVLTLAPFAVIGPFLGSLYERYPTAYRGGLVISAAVRAVLALAIAVWIDSFIVFPLAFLLLVFSRFHSISKSSLLPVVLDSRADLISANAQLARVGVLGATFLVPFGALALWIAGSWLVLAIAAGAYVWSAMSARGLPVLDAATVAAFRATRLERSVSPRQLMPRSVRLARFATAGVRFLNGFLLLLLAFAFRDVEAGVLSFSALLASAGFGYFMAAVVTPMLDRYTSEEPMVVAALAILAGASFLTAQTLGGSDPESWFGLAAAALMAGAAGFAWGTAKFGFDGLLQATMPAGARGRAFTNSETFFQFAWVMGALLPLVPGWPVELGLALAGLVALGVQVIYVSAVLIPVVAQRRAAQDHPDEPAGGDVMDLFS